MQTVGPLWWLGCVHDGILPLALLFPVSWKAFSRLCHFQGDGAHHLLLAEKAWIRNVMVSGPRQPPGICSLETSREEAWAPLRPARSTALCPCAVCLPCVPTMSSLEDSMRRGAFPARESGGAQGGQKGPPVLCSTSLCLAFWKALPADAGPQVARVFECHICSRF